MAVTYAVGRGVVSPMSQVGSDDGTTKVELSVDYEIEVSDPGNASFDPRSIDETDVHYRATGLPKVNQTSYVSAGGLIYPYTICRSRTIRRDSSRFSKFHATCKFRNQAAGSIGGSGGIAPQTKPTALTDISPQVRLLLGEDERVVYVDRSSPVKAILTPTKNFYSQPAVERIPVRSYDVLQYESSISYSQMETRKFKCNDATYAGSAAYKWIVEDVTATPVPVVLVSGSVNAVLVTYRISHSPHEHGWMDDRALIDTHYFDGAGRKQPFIDDGGGGNSIGFVTSSGARKSPGTVIPDRTQFKVQPTIDFKSFLHSSIESML